MGAGLPQDIPDPHYTSGYPVFIPHKLSLCGLSSCGRNISRPKFLSWTLYLSPGFHVLLTSHLREPALIPKIAATFSLNLSLYQHSSPGSWWHKYPHNFRGHILGSLSPPSSGRKRFTMRQQLSPKKSFCKSSSPFYFL